MADNDFYLVLTAAVEDLVTHGFDSVERVAGWTRKLREAAVGSMIRPESLEQALRDELSRKYREMVDKGRLTRLHPGIERFTLERIRPALRAELDRRIAASADLIRLNRDEAIQKTLRRFQGWSTSLPKGGPAEPEKAKTKKDIRKALAQLPFEERRVLIDQGHKLVASISDIVATDGGAIAGRWSSHWRQAGYDYREDHKERDGHIYLVRGSWAHNAGLVRPASGDGYVDDHERPAELPFCRCAMVWLYALRDLPADMLTAKGKAKLEEARAATRADAAEDVPDGISDSFERAARLDRMEYCRGFVSENLRFVPDRSQWHAEYDPDDDTITVQAKLARERTDVQVHTLLHEIGHRGQEVDAPCYEAFKALHLNKIQNFTNMANAVHLEDFKHKGHVDDLAEEVFAESYARAMLGADMPDELHRFWRARLMAAAA